MKNFVKIRHSRRDSSGFSMVELMVAMSFIGIGLLSLAQLFVMSAKSTGVARKDSQAVNLASEIVERMRSEPFQDMVDIFDNIDTKYPATVPVESREWAAHVQDQLGPGGRGRVRIVDQTEDPSLTSGLVRIEVITSWVDRGDTLNMTTSTYVSRMGV